MKQNKSESMEAHANLRSRSVGLTDSLYRSPFRCNQFVLGVAATARLAAQLGRVNNDQKNVKSLYFDFVDMEIVEC
jgi:hypothetical protein